MYQDQDYWHEALRFAPMGSPLGEGGDGGYTNDNTGGSGDGHNPAWDALLADIPLELHEKVTPHLKEWDTGVDKRFNTVHSKYNPWDAIIDSGTTPDTAQFALNLVRLIEDNPEFVITQLSETYKDRLGKSGEGSNSGQGHESQNPYQEHLDRLERQQHQIAQHMVAERRAQQEARENQAYENELARLKKQYGDFDEDIVHGLVISGRSPEDAVKYMTEYSARAARNYTPPPRVLGGGGGNPSGQKIDVTKLNPQQTNNLVAQALRAHNQANRQG